MTKYLSIVARPVLVTFLAVTALFVGAANAGAALPVSYNFPNAVLASAADPGGSPPGANDFTCQPSAAHPRPVVLIHGTFENMALNWNAISPLLKNNGYCVFAFNFGKTAVTDNPIFPNQIYGLDHIATSAGQLSAFVDTVRAATGTSKVDLIGHSQGGGPLPRYYLKNLGGGAKVNALVGLSPSNHGTTLLGLSTLASLLPFADVLVGAACPACDEQRAGSTFNTTLDAGGDTVPGVKYIVIQTKYDELATPYQNSFLTGSNVTNITLQNGCFLDGSEHLVTPYDSRAAQYILNALSPSTAKTPPCRIVLPLIGG